MATAISEPQPAGERNRKIIVGAMICVLVLVAGFFIVWNNGLRDALIPKNFGVVEPGALFRSGQLSGRLVEPTLKEHGIKVIVALSAHGGKAADLSAESDAVQRLGIDRQVFPLGGDGTGQIAQYAGAIAAIDRAEKQHKPVLVHCIAGAQRTGGVVACYELLVKHAPVDDVEHQLLAFGHDPSANPKLIPYLNEHMAELANRLVDLKVIPAAPTPLPVLPVK